MRRKGMILATLAVPAVAFAPASTARASGPLLSGYGGPGAGAQTIIGATLLNGPGGGSGGGSRGGSSPSSPTNSATIPTTGSPSAPHRSTGAVAGHGGQVAKRGSDSGGLAGAGQVAGTSAGGSGAHSSSLHHGVLAAASVRAEAPWFSGGDLLALGLVAGVLTLIAVATVRLAGAQRVH
jgi:hypothetical protein